jgi:putative heme degradation protein
MNDIYEYTKLDNVQGVISLVTNLQNDISAKTKTLSSIRITTKIKPSLPKITTENHQSKKEYNKLLVNSMLLKLKLFKAQLNNEKPVNIETYLQYVTKELNKYDQEHRDILKLYLKLKSDIDLLDRDIERLQGT